MEDLMELFDMLTSNDTEIIKMGNKRFVEQYENKTQHIPVLCEVLFSKPTPEQLCLLTGEQMTSLAAHRQMAGVLLRRIIKKSKVWGELNTLERRFVKEGIVKAMMVEDEKIVRKSMVYVLAKILQHENNDQWFGEILNSILMQCLESNKEKRIKASHLFSVLSESSPTCFKSHINNVCVMFNASLEYCERNGNFATTSMVQIFSGISNLVCYVVGNNQAEHLIVQAIPNIMKALQSYAYSNSETVDFAQAFNLLEMLTESCLTLMCNHLTMIIHFCLGTVVRTDIELDLRTHVLSCVNNIVYFKSKEVGDENLFEPIVNTLFYLVATDTEMEGEDVQNVDYYLEADEGSIIPSVLRTFELVAYKVPPEKMMPQLFDLFSRALERTTDPVARRAIYLTAGGIASALPLDFTESILNLVAMGMQEQHRCVRNAAYFAFKECNTHMASELTDHAPRMLYMLLDELRQICIQMQLGHRLPQYCSLLFESLDLIMINMELETCMPKLMEHLFEAMNPVIHLRIITWSLNAVGTVLYLIKENIAPYKDQVVNVIKQYLLDPAELTKEEQIPELRFLLGVQAVETLAALIRHSEINKSDPLLEDTMAYSLKVLHVNNTPNLRTQIFSLISALAKVVQEAMHCVYPKFIDLVFNALRIGDDPLCNMNNTENEDHISFDDEKSSEFDEDATLAYCETHMEAIFAMKEFCRYTGKAFLPYLERATMATFKLLDSYVDEIVDGALNAVPVFLTSLKLNQKYSTVQALLHQLVPKMVAIIELQSNPTVVSSAVKELTDILVEYRSKALRSVEVRNQLGIALIDLLNEKCSCHERESFNIERDFDASVQMTMRDILLSSLVLVPVFGTCLPPNDFSQYFANYCPQLLQRINETKDNKEYEDFQAMSYNCLNECQEPLQHNARCYFDTLLPKAVEACANSTCYLVRHNAMALLGELAYQVKEYAYGAYPTIMATLRNYLEKSTENVISDKLCGCIARLMIANISLVPLDHFLPVLMQNTPLQEDYEENFFILRSFKVLRQHSAQAFSSYFKHMLAVTIHILRKRQYKGDATFDVGLELLRDMCDHDKNTFDAYIAKNRNAAQFINSLKTP